LIRIIHYIKPYVGMVLLAIALLFVQANCELALPDYMADIVNTGVIGGNIPFIWNTGGRMLLITLLSAASSIIVGYLSARVGAGISRDLRADVFKKVVGFSSAAFDRFSTASLITRSTNDVTQVQTLLIMTIRIVFYAPIMGFGGVMKAVANSSSMTWIIGLAVMCLLIVIIVMFNVAMPRFKLVQQLIDRLNLVTRENLEGMLVIRAFNTQRFERDRFDKANRDLTGLNLFLNRAMALMMPVMMLIMNITTISIIWYGARQVSEFKLEVGSMMAYMQYAMQIIMSFLMLAMMFIMIPRAMVSVNRIADVLETGETVPDSATPEPFGERFDSAVEFRGVGFRYPGGEGDVLRNINFTARAGQTTAIIGSTGSGKSTLVNLILRFYDVTGGSILIDGKDIRDVPKRALREKIGYAPQKSALFSGTIRSNICYADEGMSAENMEKAADVAQAAEIIASKEGGYDSPISQGGANVSGGQRQRLSIARALAKNAPIYIFDDSFSALDLKTDANLRAALKREAGGSTIILVAQRVGTIMDADQIVVLDNGEIAGKGTHGELLKSCGVYLEIARSQLSEEELSL